MSNEAAALFPIYEAPQQLYTLPSQSSDLDSTAGGSEWGDLDSSAGTGQLSAITKEQLFQMLQKMRLRYHKYKGRYVDAANAYKELEAEHKKVRNIMQQTQDKTLRRISELKEQCALEQKAKRHLEEELRSDLEEKEHVIKTLETKVALLKSDPAAAQDEEQEAGNLIDLADGENGGNKNVLEEKIKRLEALLTKCKESIKANKQKTQALTEVKESLSVQLSEKEKECAELTAFRDKAKQDELQIAETKMVMHQEIIVKDEEIAGLRVKLNEAVDELTKVKEAKEEMEKDMTAKNTGDVEVITLDYESLAAIKVRYSCR